MRAAINNNYAQIKNNRILLTKLTIKSQTHILTDQKKQPALADAQ